MKRLLLPIFILCLCSTQLMGYTHKGSLKLRNWWPSSGENGPEIRSITVKWTLDDEADEIVESMTMQWYLGDHYIIENQRIPIENLGEAQLMLSFSTLVLSADLYAEGEKIGKITFDMGATPPHGGSWGMKVKNEIPWEKWLKGKSEEEAKEIFKQDLELRDLEIEEIEFGGLYQIEKRIKQAEVPSQPTAAVFPRRAMRGGEEAEEAVATSEQNVAERVSEEEKTVEKAVKAEAEEVEETIEENKQRARMLEEESFPEEEMNELEASEAAEEEFVEEEEQGPISIHEAIRAQNDDAINYFLEDKANWESVDERGNTPLLAAIGRGNTELAQYLIKEGVDVSSTNKRGQQAIHLAVRKNNTALVELLLDKGVEVNTLGESGMTPLHYAAEEKSYPICRLLISKEADLSIEDYFDRTAYDIARKSKSKELASMLKVDTKKEGVLNRMKKKKKKE